MQTHVKVLGVLMIVVSALALLFAAGVGAAFGIGAMATAASGDEDAAIAIPIIGITGVFVTVMMVALALPGLITGWGLLSYKNWARIVGIVLCVINLLWFPFGTLMGIYGLWVLFQKDTERLFSSPPSALTRT
jgi:hypothetical protein